MQFLYAGGRSACFPGWRPIAAGGGRPDISGRVHSDGHARPAESSAGLVQTEVRIPPAVPPPYGRPLAAYGETIETVPPVVGITCWREPSAFRGSPAELDFLEWNYIDAIVAAGGAPVLIPPAPTVAPELIDQLDALLLAGGGDIAPARYGQQPRSAIEGVVPDRDTVELTLGGAALAHDVPVLGVCRGHQLLTVLSGGTLHQDLPAPARATHAPTHRMLGEHAVDLDRGSQLGRLLGPRATVTTQHHQAIDTIGQGWTPVAWGPQGTIEAIERADARFAVGVQWHPEWSPDARIFEVLVAHGRRRRHEAPAASRRAASRPIVAVAAYRERILAGRWEIDAAALPHSFVRAVLDAGAQPLLLPPRRSRPAARAARRAASIRVPGRSRPPRWRRFHRRR